MTDRKENEQIEVMPPEIPQNKTATAAPSAPSQNLTWLLGGLLLLAIFAIIWLLIGKDSKGGEVVAIVNGQKITERDLIKYATPNEKLDYIDRAVFAILINQEAEKARIKVTEADIEKAVDLQMTEFSHMFFDEVEFEATLAMQGMTMEGLRSDIKNEPDLVTQLQLEKIFAPQIHISDDMVANYFAEQEQSLNQYNRIQASHILVDTKEEAEALLQQLKDGADFAELAKEHSKDEGSAIQGGDLGIFGRGRMVQEFEEAAYSLEVGELSDVVESEFGYHIIKLTGKQNGYTLDDDRELLRNYLFREEMGLLFEEWMMRVRSAASIEILE